MQKKQFDCQHSTYTRTQMHEVSVAWRQDGKWCKKVRDRHHASVWSEEGRSNVFRPLCLIFIPFDVEEWGNSCISIQQLLVLTRLHIKIFSLASWRLCCCSLPFPGTFLWLQRAEKKSIHTSLLPVLQNGTFFLKDLSAIFCTCLGKLYLLPLLLSCHAPASTTWQTRKASSPVGCEEHTFVQVPKHSAAAQLSRVIHTSATISLGGQKICLAGCLPDSCYAPAL